MRSVLSIAAVLSVTGLAAFADEADRVTIKFDAGDGISGEVIEVSDTSLRLDTIMGAVTIPFDGVKCIGASCPEAIRLVTSERPVTLTSLDESTVISGNLLEIDDDTYVVATDFGEMRVSVDKATCEGSACPEQPAAPGFGGEVVLTSGEAVIKGRLTGFDEDVKAYIIDSEKFGLVHVSKEAFSCAGASCPPD